jgi:serine/threonine protein phosphatase PrpC
MKGLECNCAKITTDTLTSAYERAAAAPQNANMLQVLVDAIQQANALVFQMEERVRREGVSEGNIDRLTWGIPPATCTAVMISEQTASIAHVGWCQAYLLRKGLAKQISQEHTFFAEMVRAGMSRRKQKQTGDVS